MPTTPTQIKYIMLPREFREITKVNISNECYYAIIDGEYNNSELDKFEWCKRFMRHGGVNKILDWENERNRQLTEDVYKYRKLANNFGNRFEEQCAKNKKMLRIIEKIHSLVEDYPILLEL